MKNKIILLLLAAGCTYFAFGKSDEYYSYRGEAFQFAKVIELYDSKLISCAENEILSNIKKYQGAYSADKQLMILAELDLYNNNLKLADKKLGEFIDYRPNSPFLASAKLLRAYIAFELKDYNISEKHFDAAYNKSLEDFADRGDSLYLHYAEQSLYWRGVSLYHLGRFTEAQAQFESSYRDYPGSIYSDDALYALGMIAENSQNYEKAISYYKTLNNNYPYSNYTVSAKIREANNYLILLQPSNALVTLDNLSYILNRIENNTDDGGKYEAQVNLENAGAEILYLKGEAYNLMNNFEQAEKNYTEFIAKYPESRIINYVRLGLGRIYLEKNNYAQAIENFDDIITSGAELNTKLIAQARIFRAVTLKRSGKVSEAKKDFTSLSLQEDFPMISDALFELAMIQYDDKEYDKSLKSLIKAEKTANDAQQKIKIYLLQGANYLEQKQWKEALNVYKSAEQLAQKSSEIYLVNKNWYVGEARFKQGIALENSGKYKEAIIPLQAFISEQKDDKRLDEAIFWLSEAFYRADMLKNAVDSYDKLIKKFPGSPRAEESYYGLGWAYFRQKKFLESSNTFDKMMQLFPASKYAAEVYSRQGDGFYISQNFAKAVESYTKALKYSEDNDEGQYCNYQIAHSYFKMGSYDKSIQSLLNFVKKYPRSSYSDNALYLVGWINFQLRKYTEAIEKYKYMMEVYPNSQLIVQAQYAIGDAYYNMGNFDAAIAAYKIVIEKYPSSSIAVDALKGIQYSLESLGRRDEAISITDDFIKSNPESPFSEDLRMKKGELFYTGKRYQDAVSEYNEFLKIFPKSEKNPEIYYWMAKSYMNMGDTVNTLKTFEEIYTRFPESEYAPMSLLESGIFYKEINRVIQAEAQFNALVKRYPDNSAAPQALFEVSTIAIAFGDTVKGIRINEQLMNNYPESEYAVLSRYRVATYFKILNQMDSAAANYEILAKNEVNSEIAAESAYHLGEIYKYKNDIVSAINWFVTVKDKFAGIEDWYSLSLLNLGECYEKQEEYIKAKDVYSALATLRQGDDYGAEAARRLKSIEKK